MQKGDYLPGSRKILFFNFTTPCYDSPIPASAPGPTGQSAGGITCQDHIQSNISATHSKDNLHYTRRRESCINSNVPLAETSRAESETEIILSHMHRAMTGLYKGSSVHTATCITLSDRSIDKPALLGFVQRCRTSLRVTTHVITDQAAGPDRSCRQFFRQNVEELKERKLPAKSEQDIEMLGKIDA